MKHIIPLALKFLVHINLYLLYNTYNILFLPIPKAHKSLLLTFHSFYTVSNRLANLLSIFDTKSDKNNINYRQKNGNELIVKYYPDNSNQKSYINYMRKTKHFPPANKEWLNSIYAYNSSTIKALPSLDKSLLTLLKGHLNLYSNRLKRTVVKIKSRRVEIRNARQSIKKILVSKPELKHTNSKVTITVYIYNAEKKYYLNKIKKIPAILDLKKDFFIKKTSKISLNLKSKLKNHSKSFHSLILNKDLNIDKKAFTSKLDIYQINFIKNFISRVLRKEIIHTYFEQMLAFNKIKFEKKYVLLLANKINKIYNKSVEFNFVNLKYLYLDDYIFSTAFITKIKKLSKIKKSFMIALKKFLNMFQIAPVKPGDIYNEMYNKEMIIQNSNISNFSYKALKNKLLASIDNIEHINQIKLNTGMLDKFISTNSVKQPNQLNNYDILDKAVRNFLPKLDSNWDKTDNYKMVQVFKSTKHKFLNGVRIEIAGRLTKRRSAARSIFKIRNKGNIRNRDSSDKGLSTVMFRGYAKSNLQNNKLYSKVRGGSFGFKGWLSGN